MVFEDESSDDCSSLQYITSFDDDQIPASIEDQDYNGLEKAPEGLCVEHRLPTERRVAFEGFETGRRFLVCAQPEGPNCGFVGWVDPEWPPTMHNALLKLWEMFEDSRSAKRKEDRVLDFSYVQAKMQGAEDRIAEVTSAAVAGMKTEMEKKEAENLKLQEKYAVLMNLVEARGSVIRNLKMNHLEEKEKLSEGNINFKVQVDELTKSVKKSLKRMCS
ncbi:uncharacterized protein [Aegilops tauschii subsp. strangulata]|uniref:uncharacterized protein n=1 Tax=Aegilops tauschii subsp. strangulata TaxID=200361 RepID=UPI003CC878EB